MISVRHIIPRTQKGGRTKKSGRRSERFVIKGRRQGGSEALTLKPKGGRRGMKDVGNFIYTLPRSVNEPPGSEKGKRDPKKNSFTGLEKFPDRDPSSNRAVATSTNRRMLLSQRRGEEKTGKLEHHRSREYRGFSIK